MSDIALQWVSTAYAADFSLVDDDLVADDGLRTSILLSLFTDRQAESTDVLPDNETDRRGWWADAVPVVEGDKFGSKLWLLRRSKNTPDVLSKAETYSREALQWLLDDNVASQVDVTPSFLLKPRGLALAVAVHRPGKAVTTFHFQSVWDAEAARP